MKVNHCPTINMGLKRNPEEQQSYLGQYWDKRHPSLTQINTNTTQKVSHCRQTSNLINNCARSLIPSLFPVVLKFFTRRQSGSTGELDVTELWMSLKFKQTMFIWSLISCLITFSLSAIVRRPDRKQEWTGNAVIGSSLNSTRKKKERIEVVSFDRVIQLKPSVL